MNRHQLIDVITSAVDYQQQIAHIQDIPAQAPQYGPVPEELAPPLKKYLQRVGIEQLYVHQVEAVQRVWRGENVVVVTPTASGKTMCYNLPVLDHLLKDPGAKALYIFPTKALSQDQLEGIRRFDTGIKVGVYDGDTPDTLKGEMRDAANIVITNPDMMHRGILANHLKWHPFFSNLQYIVIDEIHTYRGVFGTHFAHVLRRLRRICRHYGSNPVFITCSATIANPAEHAAHLIGLPVTLIDKNGAPQGAKNFVMWKPPQNKSYIHDVAWLLSKMLKVQAKTIAFSRARQVTERILRLARGQMQDGEQQDQLKSYRGGYLAAERRQIERELFNGQVLGVVTTNALELGIDVGELDVCIIAGFPGTIASTWQQAGRVGRRQKDALIIFIAVANPLDQYFLRNTLALFNKPTEHALIDTRNPYILLGHVLCATHELPVSVEDYPLWDEIFVSLLAILEEDGQVVTSDGKHYYLGQGYPAEKVNIRHSSDTNYQLRDVGKQNRLVGVLDGHKALSEAHPGAVYMHQGETYLVKALDTEKGIATIDQVDVDYYTMVKRDKKTEILQQQAQKTFGSNAAFYGGLRVTTKVTGYIKKHEVSGQVLGGGDLDLPEETMETTGMWITVNEEIVDKVRAYRLNLMGGLHAVEHAAIGLLPLFAMCDRNDIGGLSTPLHQQTNRPTIFIHDAHFGGVGFSEIAYHKLNTLLEETLLAITECECEVGCPSCIYSPKCSNFNRPLDKEAAICILHLLLGRTYAPPQATQATTLRQDANMHRLLERFRN